ncbi:response regulator transcription factor [Denitrificimonas sp. JX-1]|uniref:Response regulator transcription factor n=1 Tax=Denitrificimonas halotolerans TaxID=3098930 RepID=A0ABU5GPT2_9GAMM|nr:response regulator transcription factor [Denitrificimonas sp. JX-1]MDY7218966.1 response regulator transcription factor [Denitrificimonas sp. JX-1]
MSNILLVDDDQELCELLIDWLKQENFKLHACFDSQSARDYLDTYPEPDAIILDVMLPDGNGLQLLRKIHEEYPLLPVLMLSARGEPTDRIIGLELGADDYLTKPCDPRELTARLRAVLRRTLSTPTSVAASSSLVLGDLQYSPTRGVAIINAQDEVDLTVSEGRILEALLATPGEPITKQQLAQFALGRKLTLYDRSLDMHISNLRRKLGPHPNSSPRIVALRGRGYFYNL